jgi:DNA-binding NarL/FixJ family response regulator
MKFLIVDDNPILNEFMTSFLKKKGHEASALTEPRRVVHWLEGHIADAVIMDIVMPDIDGVELTRNIHEKFPELPIVIFTGKGYDTELMQRAAEAGASGYVSKGIGPNEIYSEVMSVLARAGMCRN